MDISSLQGSTAYTAPTPPVDHVGNTATREQNLETSDTTHNAQTTSADREAFEVTISQDAQERTNQEQLSAEATTEQATDSTEPTELIQAQPTENPDDRTRSPEQGPSPLVNIVA